MVRTRAWATAQIERAVNRPIPTLTSTCRVSLMFGDGGLVSSEQYVLQLRFDTVRAALLSLELSSDGPDLVIAIGGDLDMSTAHLLTELVEHVVLVVRDPAGPVVLDMAGVTFFCADGIRALIRAREMIIAAGGRLTLRDPSPPTRRVLAITGDDQLFGLRPAAPRSHCVESRVRSDRVARTATSSGVRWSRG